MREKHFICSEQVPSRLGVVLVLICLSSSFPRWPSLPRPQNPQTEVLSRTTRCSSFGTETKDGKMRRPQGGPDGLWLSLINVSPTMQDERCHNHVGSHGRRADFPWHLVFYIEEIGELMFIHLFYQEKMANHEDLWIQSPSPSR